MWWTIVTFSDVVERLALEEVGVPEDLLELLVPASVKIASACFSSTS